MARTRSIHPGAPQDEDVATLSIHARYVWAFLPCHADKEGRLVDKPFALKLDILPLDAVDMNALLDELARARHIIRYVGADGRRYIQIRSFRRWQNPHKNEADSRIPPPPEGAETTREVTRSWNESRDIGVHAHTDSRNYASTPSDPGPDPSPCPGPSPNVPPPAREDRVKHAGRRSVCEAHPDGCPPNATPLRALDESLGGHEIAKAWSETRSHVLGTLPWVTAKGPAKADAIARQIRSDHDAIADVVPSMVRLLVRAQQGAIDRADEAVRDATWGFGVWCSRFTDLRDELRGRTPPAPPKSDLARTPARGARAPDIRVGHVRAEQREYPAGDQEL